MAKSQEPFLRSNKKAPVRWLKFRILVLENDCGPQSPSPAFFKIGEIFEIEFEECCLETELRAKGQELKAKNQEPLFPITAMSAITRDVGDLQTYLSPNTGGACSKAQPPPATPQVLSRGHEAVAPTVGHSDTAVAGRFGVSPGQPAFIAGCGPPGAAPRRIKLQYRIQEKSLSTDKICTYV